MLEEGFKPIGFELDNVKLGETMEVLNFGR